jgi:hypothetical protein
VSTLEVERSKHVVHHAADRSQLEKAPGVLPPSAYPLILQQRIVGPGTGIFLLLWDGRVRAVFAHRRLREKPPAGGVSVYRESIVADPALVERSRRLLARLHWQGVAMVEFKIDAFTGTPYLMEINGRFWGSLQLAIDAGIDLDGRRSQPLVVGRCRSRARDVPAKRSRERAPTGSPGAMGDTRRLSRAASDEPERDTRLRRSQAIPHRDERVAQRSLVVGTLADHAPGTFTGDGERSSPLSPCAIAAKRKSRSNRSSRGQTPASFP